MNKIGYQRLRVAAAAALAFLLVLVAGCTVSKKEEGGQKKVDIQTPLGSMKIDTDPGAQDTGLPVYPGARLAKDEDREHSSAHVKIDSSLFGVNVIASKYDSDDPPEKILDFYRKQLKSMGEVVECRGEIDFKLHHGEQKVGCRESPGGKEVQLAVGTEERHRIVSVKPQGKGSQLGLIYIQTRGEKTTL